MNGFYTNNEMQALDCEFANQLQRIMNMVPAAVVNQIRNDWEINKMSVLNGLKSKYANVGGYNTAIIQARINDFIQLGVSSYTRGMQMPNYGMNMGMPMGAMMQNPYLAQQQHGYGMMQPQMGYGMSPFGMPQQMSPITTPQMAPQPTVGASLYTSVAAPQAPQQQPAQQAAKGIPGTAAPVSEPVVKVTKAFQPPMNDEPDPTYGCEEHETGIGKFKVISMIGSSGEKYKHVLVNLYDPCPSDEEALIRAKRLYRGGGIVYMDITYDKLAIVEDVPSSVLSKIIASIKKSIPLSSRAANKLKYLQQIYKIINDECKNSTIINGIENFFMNLFNESAAKGLVSSDDNITFVQDSISKLIALSDPESKDPGVKGWRSRRGFVDKFKDICDSTIKDTAMTMKVLDINNQKDLSNILKMYIGLTESDNGDLVDVTGTIVEKLDTFVKASEKDKEALFGQAGHILLNSSVVILKNQHAVYSKLPPIGSYDYTVSLNAVHTDDMCMGGYTDDKPDNPDNLFEYMLTRCSCPEGKHATVFVDYGPCITKYSCVMSSDRWHILNKTGIMD